MVSRIWRGAPYCCPRGPHRRCHRCRSKAGWRDRQVLSGCRFIDIAAVTYVNGRSKAARVQGGVARFALKATRLLRGRSVLRPALRSPSVLGDDHGGRFAPKTTRLLGGLLVSRHERLIHSNAAFVAETLVNRRAFVASRVRHQRPTKP